MTEISTRDQAIKGVPRAKCTTANFGLIKKKDIKCIQNRKMGNDGLNNL